MTTTDPRLNNVVFIGGSYGTARRSPGLLRGSTDAPMNKRIQSIKVAVDEFQRRDADLRASRAHMTLGEIEERRRGHQSVLLKDLESHAAEVTSTREALRLRVVTASAVRPGREVDFYQSTLDREMRDQFRALSLKDRAIKLHQMLHEPLLHLSMVEALLRAPIELSGLSYEDAATMRVKVFAQRCPGEFAAMDDEVEQLNTATKAVALACVVLGESGAGSADILREAPTAHALSVEPKTIGWLPPGVDSRYEPEREE